MRNKFFITPQGEGAPDDASNILIPEGKTTIGRGSFLDCSEKRVSRAHAVLEVTPEGELFITPTHVNPCFYHEKGVLEPLVVLAKGDPQRLHPGDQFSLLPDSVRFAVGVQAGAEHKQKSLENGALAKEPGEDHQENTQTTAIKKEPSPMEDEVRVKVEQDHPAASETEDSSEIKSSNRTLPAWMVAASNEDSSAEKPVSKKRAPKQKLKEPKKEKDGDAVSGEEDEKAGASSPKPENGEGKKPPITVKHEISDDDVNEESETEAGDGKAAFGGKRKNTPGDDASRIKRRKPCEYGKKCYRKNPTHLKTCSHPGDEDYASDAEVESKRQGSDEDSRPECIFGMDCYRKNRKHREEFKHTQRPQRKAAREARRKTAARDVDSEDDSFESSFLDDDSNDDSNYSPDDEDLRTLKKEAREFTSNKKLYEMKS